MKHHQITGVGPQAADGSVDLFTVLPKPFNVSADWLAAQTAYPSVGNELVEAEDGSLSLMTQAQEADAEAEEGTPSKKADGEEGSQTGSAPSPLPSYTAKPTVIYAGKIVAITDGQFELENGQLVSIHSNVGVGDYWIEDGNNKGYIPAAEFDRLFVAN